MYKIKFRSWLKAENKMLYDFGILEHPGLSEDDRHVLMQYTGLKDKNGKEIYEGDVIEIVNNLNEETKKNKTYAVVKYKEGSFVATWKDEFMGEEFNHFDSYNTPIVTFEVIGDIYSTPELLKKVNQ